MEKDKQKYYKRRQYFVAKKFQLKYTGQIIALMFLTAALCAYVVYYNGMILLGEKLASVYPQGRLVAIIKTVNMRMLFSIIMVSPLVAILGIFLSHRIAGPIFRMEKVLNNIAAGDLTQKIVLREKDEMINLANGINTVTESFKLNVTSEKSRLNKIREALEDAKKSLASKPHDLSALKGDLTKLDAEINGMTHELNKYKLP